MAEIRDSRFRLPVSDAEIGPPLLRRLLQDWRQACPDNDTLPPAAFIDPFRLRYLIDSLIVVEVVPQPGGGLRYLYRLIGTDLVAHSGRDQTGRWVDTHPEPELSAIAIETSDAVVAARQPALLEFRRSFFGRYYPVTALVLPLAAAADGRPTRLLVSQLYPKDTPRQPFGGTG